jgi:hypothetical protein
MNRPTKALIPAIFAISHLVGHAQTAEELFVRVPKDAVTVEGEKRRELIAESKGDFLKLKLDEETTGEFKIVSQKKDEFLVGVILKDCEHSRIAFWQMKKDVWKDVTDKVIEPVGKNDVVEILKVSPVEIENLNQKVNISFFYTFEDDSGNLRLIARKQDNCEIAGTVYRYTFNGKKYIKDKK